MSATKTLKLKRVFAYSVHNNLKNTAPKEFPTTGEIKETINSVLPALKEHIGGFVELLGKVEALQLKVTAKEFSEEEVKAKVDEINVAWKEYNTAHGSEVCEIVLSEEGFNTLRGQFEREGWGTKWTMNMDEYAEMMAAFSEAGK